MSQLKEGKLTHHRIKAGLHRRAPAAALVLIAVLSAQERRTTTVTAENLQLLLGASLVVDRPADINRISISNPDVVDAVAVSSREVVFNAKAAGVASIVIWSKTGERTQYSVTVEPNLEPVRRLLRETFPGENIDVRASRDSMALVGRASSQAVADRATALVAPLVKTVVNNLQVVPPGLDKQIVLRVKFAEINRNVVSSFGINLLSTGALNTPGRITTGQFPSASPGELSGSIPGRVAGTKSSFSISDALNIFAFRPDLNLGAIIRDLENRGQLQILAEPNLVTTNGKEASFLVGGEFPVPVVQGGQAAGAVTIQFREFGIRLTFLPQVTPNNTIKMHVKPEVSTIDLANSVVFSGFTIPALATRRMETDIELGEGQSFIIAGLIDDRITENLARVPGLSHIPILGALFRSRSESKSKTELLVMVTPESAYPVVPTDPSPLPKMFKQGLPPLFPARAGTPPNGAPVNVPTPPLENTAGPNETPAAGNTNPAVLERNGGGKDAGTSGEDAPKEPAVRPAPQATGAEPGISGAEGAKH